jgi:hypothetical protein
LGLKHTDLGVAVVVVALTVLESLIPGPGVTRSAPPLADMVDNVKREKGFLTPPLTQAVDVVVEFR